MLDDEPRGTAPSRPAFSVVMITYNQVEYIREALDSVLKQTLDEPFEVIVGEDHSTDGTASIVEEYRSQHPGIVRVISGPRNVGMTENFRRTMAEARGEFVAFCEGDDYWHLPDKLARQLALFRARPTVGMVYSDYDHLVSVDGRWRIQHNVVHGYGRPPPDGDAFEDLLDWVPAHLSTIACRSSLMNSYLESDLLDLTLRLGDVPLILYCAAMAEVAFLPVSTSVYRSAPGSAVNSGAARLLGIIQDHVAVVRRFETRFASAPERCVDRQPVLESRIANAAFAAGDIATHRRIAKGRKDALRRALMRVPPIHRLYLARVRARQSAHFVASSQLLTPQD